MRQSRVRKARLSPDPTSGDDHQVFSAYPQTTESDAVGPQVLPQPRSPARQFITTCLEKDSTATATPDSTSMTKSYLVAAAFGTSTDSLPPTISETSPMMENSNSQIHEPLEPRADKGEPRDNTEELDPVQSPSMANRESIPEEATSREQLLAALRSAREQNQNLLERRWSLSTGVTAPPQYEAS